MIDWNHILNHDVINVLAKKLVQIYIPIMIRSKSYKFYNYSSGTSTTKYFMGNRLSARVIVMNKTKKKLWKWAYLHIYSLLLLYISFKINISRNSKEGFCVRHDICCN